MNALHEKRKGYPTATPVRPVNKVSTREHMANLNPIEQQASLQGSLDMFSDSVLLKVMSMAHSSLVSVQLQTTTSIVWGADALQQIIDLVSEATETARLSPWRGEIVMQASYVFIGYYRALGEIAYHRFIMSTLPDGFFEHPVDDDTDF